MTQPESWPTIDAATAAVDAAARKTYDLQRTPDMPEWDLLERMQQFGIKSAVLPVVLAALSAISDPRYVAWEEGFAGGCSDTAYECEGSGLPPSSYPHTNPYQSPEVTV